jgi:hypothetical protein
MHSAHKQRPTYFFLNKSSTSIVYRKSKDRSKSIAIQVPSTIHQRNQTASTNELVDDTKTSTPASLTPISSSKHRVPLSIPPPKHRIIRRVVRRRNKESRLIHLGSSILFRTPNQIDVPSYLLPKRVFLNSTRCLLVDWLHILVEYLRDNPLGYDVLVRVVVA